MANNFVKFFGVAQDAKGNAISGATITVFNATIGVAALLFSDDGSTSVSNPFIADSLGRFSFYFAPKNLYNLTVSGGAESYTLTAWQAEFVKQHREASPSDHALHSITADHLSFDIDQGDQQIAVHAARQTEVHGVPVGGAFAYSTGTVTTTNSPTFADITGNANNLTQLLKAGVVKTVTNAGSLATTVAAASAGDTILMQAGTYVQTATGSGGTVVINKSITIKSIGRTVISNGGSSSAMTIAASNVVIEGLEFQGNGTAPTAQIIITSGDMIKFTNCKINGGGQEGLVLSESAGTIGQVHLVGCEIFDNTREGLRVTSSSGPVLAERCNIYDNGSGLLYQVRLNKGAAESASGHNFVSCRFKDATREVLVDSKNCKFVECFFEGALAEALNITANGTNCYVSTKIDTIEGSIVDPGGNIVSDSFTANYISGITNIDNSGGTYTKEYFYEAFTHNLGTRNLMAALLVANTSIMNDKVWIVSPQFSRINSQEPQGGRDMSLVSISDNEVRLLLYAGDVSTGSGYTSGGEFIFFAVDPTAIQAGVNDGNYDFTAVGGFPLKQIWVRLYLFKL